MKHTLTIGATLLLTTSMAHAVGLDRSNQNIGVIFQDGNYAELSFGYVMPSVSGTDVASVKTGNVADDYSILGLGYKTEINDQLSFALIIDEPYGADVNYPTTSPVLGGTAATLDSVAFTGMLRYKLNENISFHGGLRAQSTEGEVTLQGDAYAGLSGYNVVLDRHLGFGYAIGAAYEIPDIALRVAVTYFSEIEHRFGTTERVGPNPVPTQNSTKVTTPQAINLDFQTGIAADTLLFGSVRWAEYSVVKVSPDFFASQTAGSSLTNIEDGFGYTLGVGRRFSDTWSGNVSFGYEPEGDDLVSPLAPTNGNYSFGVGGQYTMDDVIISGGVRYIVPGDASPATATPSVARASFSDNSAVAVGFKVAYTY